MAEWTETINVLTATSECCWRPGRRPGTDMVVMVMVGGDGSLRGIIK